MALPTSPTWNLADFSGDNFDLMLTVEDADMTAVPSLAPYFTYSSDLKRVIAGSDDGVEGSLNYQVSLPQRYTLDVTLRCPKLPHNLGDLAQRRFGFTVADDQGRGVTLYFAKTGVAISRVDNYGAATALPDTSDVTEAVSTVFYTLRIAVDGGLGRAYVFVGQGITDTPSLRWVIPVEQTPTGTGDTFRLFAKGTAQEPVRVEITQLRLANQLVVANYPPISDAGPDRVAPIGQAVRFDGRASYDVEGVPLRYKWTCIDAPYGSRYAEEVSSLQSSDDGDADGLTAFVDLEPQDIPSWLQIGDVLRIRGVVYEVASIEPGRVEVTSDYVPDDLDHEVGRFIRQSILVSRVTPTPVAIPDLPGVYRFRLIVNDGEVDSEASEVLANITALQTPMGVEPDLAFLWKAIGDEWRLIPGKEIFQEAWTGVAQILAGKMLESWQHHYNTSIRDAQRVFQRKWLAYRTLLAETAPDEVTIGPRFGGFITSWKFENGLPNVSGKTLEIHALQPGGVVGVTPVYFDPVEFLNTGSPAWLIAQQIYDVLQASGNSTVWVNAHSTREAGLDLQFWGRGRIGPSVDELELQDGSFPSWIAVGDQLYMNGKRFACVSRQGQLLRFFGLSDATENSTFSTFAIYRTARITLAGSAPFFLAGDAADVLGLPTQRYNTLQGTTGVRVTDRVYYVEGYDLQLAGVQRGDLLVVNNGESFTIDRLLRDPGDPLPGGYQRVLLFEAMPEDTGATWSIPSVIRSTAVDYEREGAYPGDLAKAEVYQAATGQVTYALANVVAQKGTQLAVDLKPSFYEALLSGYELRFLGVKRRKAMPLPNDVLSIPTLQELIAESLNPVRLREHVDYILEPFYREEGGYPVPMLQFSDATYITPDLEPPDVLWAETTLFDNEVHVEDLFGRLVGFLRDDAASFPKDFNYVAGVAGLLYAQQHGPSLFAMSVGTQILLGQPFAEAAGYIEEIRANYSPKQGRILIRDDDGNKPTQSDTVRAYYYTKNPDDLSAASGLAINEATSLPWTAGDHIPQFSPIGSGITLEDIYENPKWWHPFAANRSLSELEKFHSFVCTFNLEIVDLANISLLYSLLNRIKPTYTRAMLVGAHDSFEDIDIKDRAEFTLEVGSIYDTLLGNRGYKYDDYRGDGHISSWFDDGATRFDALVDDIVDTIRLVCTVVWPGGNITIPSNSHPWDAAYPVIDIDGVKTGTPGGTFNVSNGMTLPAGTYQTNRDTKTGPILPPMP